MDFKNILYEAKNNIAYITINREKVLNAIDNDTMDELFDAFRAFDADKSLGCAILTGKGKAFVAGGDIAAMAKQAGPVGDRNFINRQKLTEFMEDMEKPVIAAINGFAFGGGCELCLACDIRIASSTAKLGQLEINLGIIPLMGGTQRLPRLVGKGMAKYLILTGKTIDAAEALRIGLVEAVVEPDQLMAECEDIANMILSKSPVCVSLVKAAVNLSAKTDLATGLLMEGYLAADSFATEDRVEGMTAFIEKRPANFKGK